MMIIVNFKNYVVDMGALELTKKIEKYLPGAIVSVSDYDIENISKSSNLIVFAQHVDYFKTNRATGFAIPEIIKKAGAQGSLLNHSEHKLGDETITKTIKRTHVVGLKIVLCVENLKRMQKLKELKPWAMAFEDPELVASGKSITEYKTKEVEKFVHELRRSKIIPLCGAGIHTKQDIITAKKLECKGVLISSAIATTPLKKVEILLQEISEIKF